MPDYRKLSFDELGELYAEEVMTRVGQREMIVLALDVAMAGTLFANVQLALRHEKNIGFMADQLRACVKQLQDALSDTPAIAEACRRGWDPKFDQVDHANVS